MSKIVILNGSPRKDGNTSILVNEFIKGASKNDNEIEHISILDYKINGCLGCNACFNEEKKCVQNDDMSEVYTKLKDADVLVVASPLYFFQLSGQLKCILDRLHNPIRNSFLIKKLAFIGTSGSSKESAFSSIKDMFDKACNFFKFEDIGFIIAGGMHEKGDVQNTPYMMQAYSLGESIK